MKFLVQFDMKGYGCEYCQISHQIMEAVDIHQLKKDILNFLVDLYSDPDDTDWSYVNEMFSNVSIYELSKIYKFNLAGLKESLEDNDYGN